MNPDTLQFDNQMLAGIPLFRDLLNPELPTPYFNKWKWLPHPETNAESGIFIRCNTKFCDSIIDLPERIPVNYGLHKARFDLTEDMAASLERDFFTPNDNHITPSALGGIVFVSMRFGKFNGVYYDLNELFEFFSLIRTQLLAGTVNGGVAVGKLSFRWNGTERLHKFAVKFADAFYEWETQWNPNL